MFEISHLPIISSFVFSIFLRNTHLDMESEDDENKRKIISPKYGVELTQKEVDIIQKCQRDAIIYHALPLAVIYSGTFFYTSRKHAQRLGALRGLIGITASLVGYTSGIYIGGLKLDSRILQECPDGNAAKIILAKMGKGEMPKRVDEEQAAASERETRGDGSQQSLQYQPDIPRTQQDSINTSSAYDSQPTQRAKKTNKYGDPIE